MQEAGAPLRWRELRRVLHSNTESITQFNQHRLGGGAFCRGVYHAVHKKRDIAVKIANIKHTGTLQHEADILAKLSHDNVIRCLSKAIDKPKYAYLQFEYVHGCDLFTFFSERTPTLPRQRVLTRTMSDLALTGRRHIARSLLSALEYLHTVNIVHNDVKLENIMVGAALLSRITEETPVKLLDFGLAYEMDTKAQTSFNRGGSVQWIAPEKVAEKDFDIGCAGDIFSFGLIIYAMMDGHMPYQIPDNLNAPEIYIFFEKTLPLVQRRIVDTEGGLLARREVKEVLLSTLKQQPKARKTATALLKLDLFKDS